MITINGITCNGFIVTGTMYRTGKRFTQTYSGTKAGWGIASCINLWNGSVWGIDNSGTRRLLKRVKN